MTQLIVNWHQGTFSSTSLFCSFMYNQIKRRKESKNNKTKFFVSFHVKALTLSLRRAEYKRSNLTPSRARRFTEDWRRLELHDSGIGTIRRIFAICVVESINVAVRSRDNFRCCRVSETTENKNSFWEAHFKRVVGTACIRDADSVHGQQLILVVQAYDDLRFKGSLGIVFTKFPHSISKQSDIVAGLEVNGICVSSIGSVVAPCDSGYRSTSTSPTVARSC